MSRKDTIIIAVLINAGLLIILFACALKSNTPAEQLIRASQEKIPQSLLSDDKRSEPASSPAPASIALAPPSPMPQSPHPINFADDLKAFTAATLPELPAPMLAPLATPVPLEEKKPVAEYTEVKVKKGDVLEKIARQHQTSVDAIVACNNLPSTNLRIGQTLKIPSQKKTPVSSTPSNPAAEIKYYTVKNGDNPWTIAVKNRIKVEELLKLNDLDQEKARKLKPGDKLIISRN